MEMIPLHKFCHMAAFEKMCRDYLNWQMGVDEIQEELDHYLEFETLPFWEINLMASKLEELKSQKKEMLNAIERVRYEMMN